MKNESCEFRFTSNPGTSNPIYLRLDEIERLIEIINRIRYSIVDFKL